MSPTSSSLMKPHRARTARTTSVRTACTSPAPVRVPVRPVERNDELLRGRVYGTDHALQRGRQRPG